MLNQIKKFTRYLLGKTSELKELDSKDALLAKTVLDIHRKRTHSQFVLVPLFALKQIHAIDRDNAYILVYWGYIGIGCWLWIWLGSGHTNQLIFHCITELHILYVLDITKSHYSF